MFELHPRLLKKHFIIELPLCMVLLEDNRHYPWIYLVPKRAGAARLIDLSTNDQMQLMKEMDLAQNILWKLFEPTQLNVATIGNKIPQLHVHIICRKEGDPAWPEPAWGHPTKESYSEDQKNEIITRIRAAFLAHQ